MKYKIFLMLLIPALLIAACGSSTTPEPTPDVAAVRTSAASTVVSQFTLTAAAFSPTPPPPPTNTSAPEPTATETELPIAQVTNAEGTAIELCDKYSWDINTVDVNYPDNTVVSPGEEFTKTWKIKNTGSCAWDDGYVLVYSYGEKMDGVFVPFTSVIAPGEETEVSVTFKAPDLAGTYFSVWTMQNPKGITFLGNNDKAILVQIVVQ